MPPISDYPQRVERVRMVTLCLIGRQYRATRVWAMRVDGRIGQPFSSEQEMVCEAVAPERERKSRSDMLREGP